MKGREAPFGDIALTNSRGFCGPGFLYLGKHWAVAGGLGNE